MIRYVKGDATKPDGGEGMIAHVVNDKGGWGAGFVLSVSKRWKQPESRYREWAKTGSEPESGEFRLGYVQYVKIESRLWVANMLAQDGYGTPDRIPLRYDFLKVCLEDVASEARRMKISVHMPRIGCGLAGGSWDKVGPLVEKALDGFDVYVYDL